MIHEELKDFTASNYLSGGAKPTFNSWHINQLNDMHIHIEYSGGRGK